MAWLSGWSYRKEISITGQSGAGTDFQVVFDIGDSAGGDFHLEGHCTNFPQDIAVTDNDGSTPIDYWIEDITADPLKMWVEVADDLGSNQTIYIYYGKSGATTNSNGANTFVQYHGTASANYRDTPTFSPTEFIYESSTLYDADTDDAFIGATVDDASWTDSVFARWNDAVAPDGDLMTYAKNEDSASYSYADFIIGFGLYHTYKLVKLSGSVQLYYDDVAKGAAVTTNLPDETLGLGLLILSGTPEQAWSFVRKYNSPEPAFSSAGSEETPPTGAAPTGVFYGPLVGPLGGPL